jgi:hypothetical protein
MNLSSVGHLGTWPRDASKGSERNCYQPPLYPVNLLSQFAVFPKLLIGRIEANIEIGEYFLSLTELKNGIF